MGEVGNIVYGSDYGTGMGKPPKATVTPTPETHYVVTECPDCAALRSRIATLEAQVDNFRDGLQRARDLYREKSGKPDSFAGEGDWWNEPDDQCVVLWLLEWTEDITADVCKDQQSRIATLEAQVEQARGLIDSAMEMMGEGCSSCNACSVGGPYDPHCPYGVWLEARFNFLQALREGGENG